MPKPILFLAALLAGAPAAFPETTALAALKLLPSGAAGRLARIEAHEGQPSPDRWHFLVHDAKAESGLHEYVVAGGEVVASRAVSQFAEVLTAGDVLGETVRIDSDRAAKLAQQYAQANKLTIASLNYELKKPGDGAAPLWKVTCIDPAGKPFGHLILTATRGTVVTHDGFPTTPAAASEKAEVSEKPRPPATTEKPERPRTPPGSQIARTVPGPERPAQPPAAERPERSERKPEVRRAEAVVRGPRDPVPPIALETVDADEDEDEEPRESRPGLLRRVGGSLQKAVTGRDTIGRPEAPR